MPIKPLIVDAKQRMDASLETVRRELATMRTGRASLSMLDGIKVDYYGTPTPLGQVGNLSVPDPTLILLQPWDPSLLQVIEKAIRSSDLDLNPQNDGKIIRIPIPSLTEERRKTLVKHAHQSAEEGRVAIRNVRRDANKTAEGAAELTDDDFTRLKEDVDKLTKDYEGKVNAALEKKTKEITEV